MASNGQKRAARPDAVKVGNHVYSIEWIDGAEWEARHYEENADATTHASLQSIVVLLHKGASESHYHEVVWHELTHAVWDSSMLTHTDLAGHDDPEETVIMHQTPLQVSVLKQNPGLVAWMLSDGTEVRT